jgi:hypothetical protein
MNHLAENLYKKELLGFALHSFQAPQNQFCQAIVLILIKELWCVEMKEFIY